MNDSNWSNEKAMLKQAGLLVEHIKHQEINQKRKNAMLGHSKRSCSAVIDAKNQDADQAELGDDAQGD